MKTLSMGMTNSYKVAIEEGANIVRIEKRYLDKESIKSSNYFEFYAVLEEELNFTKVSQLIFPFIQNF